MDQSTPQSAAEPKQVAEPDQVAEPKQVDPEAAPKARKGPLNFLSGSLTALLLGWLCLGLSQKVVTHYALHPPNYSSAIAQSIATAMKTLVVGMSFLATFSFGFIGLGLFLVFIRSLLPGTAKETA
jgi:hypothetical protein